MVTARQEPRLVLVSLTCDGGRACLNGPNMEELSFPLKQPDNPIMDCRSLSGLQSDTTFWLLNNWFFYFILLTTSLQLCVSNRPQPQNIQFK